MTTLHGDHMTTSESPTRPDAPRAGGETPPMTETQVDDLFRDLQSICERAHDEAEPYWRNAAVKERAVLRNQLRSALLERHRDGERLAWFFDVLHKMERVFVDGRWQWRAREYNDDHTFCGGIASRPFDDPRAAVDDILSVSAGPSPERA